MKSKNLAEISELLSEKQGLLSELLKRSSDYGWETVQALTEWVEGRTEVIDSIDILDKKIESIVTICEKKYPKIRNALNNSCNRGELCSELLPIFDTTQQNYTILNRIKTISDEVMIRIEKMQNEVREGIKQNNQKTKIVKYFPNEKIEIFRERG